MTWNTKILPWCLIFSVTGCLEPYQSPDAKTDLAALVVDGFVNTANASATVKLSRSQPLNATGEPKPETKAIVTLEELGTSVTIILPETTAGLYSKQSLVVKSGSQYRLHIRTASLPNVTARNYYSDFRQFSSSPAIDSVTWEAKEDGVQIYVATHGLVNTTGYYLWTFDETWEYHTFYNATHRIADGNVITLTKEEDIPNKCWSTELSRKILAGNTRSLSQNVITQFPITFIPKASLRLNYIYSILVKQQVIDEKTFNFWEQLQKTTESIGGLFDPLPYQVSSNIYNATNPSEVVLGFFDGGSLTTERLYIKLSELPDDFRVDKSASCPLLPLAGDLSSLNNTYLVAGFVPPPVCIVCTVQGGTRTKPSFWPF